MGRTPKPMGTKHGFRDCSSTELNYTRDAIGEVPTQKQPRVRQQVNCKERRGREEPVDNSSGSLNGTADTGARSLSVGGCPEHRRVLSSIPGPHTFNARSTPNVTTTDIPRYHLMSSGEILGVQ